MHTIERYLSGLVNSFILYKASRYDVKGKQYLRTGERYYVADVGLRYYLLGNKEIDFIVINESEYEYYQVSGTVRDANTLKRELEPLNGIADHFPKYLLTMDITPPISHNGIKQLNVIDWLLKKEI